MRILCLLLIFVPQILFASAGSREDFLSAWEGFQKNSELIDDFRKVEGNKYYIKFKSLPYEGDLVLLTYDVDEIRYGPDQSVFTKTGYVEVDLPGAIDDLMQKYNRTYHRWAQSNMLYYNDESSEWITAQEYASSLTNEPLSTENQIFVAIFEYWSYILIGIILYFLWSTIVNNKRTKVAIKNQELMLKKSLALGEESLNLQKQSIKESLELHKNTNQCLLDILNEIKDKKVQ